jgi:hypothetical protein
MWLTKSIVYQVVLTAVIWLLLGVYLRLSPAGWDPKISISFFVAIPAAVIAVTQLIVTAHIQRSSSIKDYALRFRTDKELTQSFHYLVYRYSNKMYESFRKPPQDRTSKEAGSYTAFCRHCISAQCRKRSDSHYHLVVGTACPMTIPPEYQRATDNFHQFLSDARDFAELETVNQAYTMAQALCKRFAAAQKWMTRFVFQTYCQRLGELCSWLIGILMNRNTNSNREPLWRKKFSSCGLCITTHPIHPFALLSPMDFQSPLTPRQVPKFFPPEMQEIPPRATILRKSCGAHANPAGSEL